MLQKARICWWQHLCVFLWCRKPWIWLMTYVIMRTSTFVAGSSNLDDRGNIQITWKIFLRYTSICVLWANGKRKFLPHSVFGLYFQLIFAPPNFNLSSLLHHFCLFSPSVLCPLSSTPLVLFTSRTPLMPLELSIMLLIHFVSCLLRCFSFTSRTPLALFQPW